MSKIEVRRLTPQQRQELKIPETAEQQGGWSVWECAPSEFDWHYDQQEQAYVYAGQVTVTTADQEVQISPGDFVTFPAGLDCHWEVQQKIVKVYQFLP